MYQTQYMVNQKKITIDKILISTFVLIFSLVLGFGYKTLDAAITATLSLSPTSGTTGLNQNFSVNIMLDTAGNATDGVDVFSVHFNPAILQVVDDNGSLAGVQITPGSLMPATTANIVDNTAGTIQFSQASSGGSNFTGSGILATINFKGVSGGTSAVTMDANLGNTSDSNVAFQGTDLLASVTNASFTVDVIGPAVSITVPTTGATVSGSSVTVSASATDSGSGVAGVQFKLDGVNINAEDVVSPYSIVWNASSVSNGSHTLTAVARDAAGNTSTSAGITVTVNNADSVAPTVSITTPTAGATVSGSSVTVSASASDNVGVIGVQFKLDGANLSTEDTSSPYSIVWNTTSATEGSHSLTAVARDAASNQTTSSAISVTVANTFQRTIQIDPEARQSKVLSGTLNVLNPAKNSIRTYSFTTNASGQATITFDISPQTVYLKINPVPFLARLISLDLNTNTTYIFPKLFIGDIVQDNIINSVDYSSLNSKWFTNDSATDLNKDNIVNSIDFSFMNQHWLVTGDI